MTSALKRRTLSILPAVLSALCATALMAQDAAPIEFNGDPDKGRIVYQRVGICVNCHGWAGDGKTGRNPRAPDAGASLRETGLDAEGLYDVVRCGLPGTEMPYHDGAAYKDGRCFGLTEADFEGQKPPIRGKTMRPNQMIDLVAYMQEHMVGRGEPTYEECVDYFQGSADKACAYLKPKE